MNVNNDSGSGVQRTYTAKEVAEILGVSLRTAYNLCETTKDFKVIRMGRRCLRIHKESFDQWFNSASGASP
jgi:excisionase family DNA binding protein